MGVRVLVHTTNKNENVIPEMHVHCKIKAEDALKDYQEGMVRFQRQMADFSRSTRELGAFLQEFSMSDEERLAKSFSDPARARRIIQTTYDVLPESPQRTELGKMLQLPDSQICAAYQGWATSQSNESLDFIMDAFRKKMRGE